MQLASMPINAIWRNVAKGSEPVLVERGGLGRTPQFTTVLTGDLPQSKIVNMQITGHDGKHLTGTPILEAGVN